MRSGNISARAASPRLSCSRFAAPSAQSRSDDCRQRCEKRAVAPVVMSHPPSRSRCGRSTFRMTSARFKSDAADKKDVE